MNSLEPCQKFSKIKWTFSLFDSQAFNRMGVYHRCPYITMPQQLLNSTDIVIGLQKMGSETMTETMG